LKGGRIHDALDTGEVGPVFKAMARVASLSASDAARISRHSARVGADQDIREPGADPVGHCGAANLHASRPKWVSDPLGRRTWSSYNIAMC